MTVEEYERKFSELSRFAPATMANERERCNKFETGLRWEIRSIVASNRIVNFGDLVESTTMSSP